MQLRIQEIKSRMEYARVGSLGLVAPRMCHHVILTVETQLEFELKALTGGIHSLIHIGVSTLYNKVQLII